MRLVVLSRVLIVLATCLGTLPTITSAEIPPLELCVHHEPFGSEQEWESLGKKIFHEIAGDDLSAFFGFSPRLKIISTPQPNAFAMISHELVVSSGLLERVENQEEYAFILAHELAHMILGHHHTLKSHTSGSIEHLRAQVRHEIEADKLALELLADGSCGHQSALSLLTRIKGEFEPSAALASLSFRIGALENLLDGFRA